MGRRKNIAALLGLAILLTPHASASIRSVTRPPAAWLPSVEAVSLAEVVAERPLTDDELALVSANWLTRFVYLREVVAARFRGEAVTRALPTTADGCLTSALYDLAVAAEDAAIDEGELEALWAAHGDAAVAAFFIASDGLRSQFLDSRISSTGGRARGAAFDLWVYYEVRSDEPLEVQSRVDFLVERGFYRPGLALTRLVEAGPGAVRDRLAALVASEAPTADPTSTAEAAVRFRVAANFAAEVLIATGDPRVTAASSSVRDWLRPDLLAGVLAASPREPGEPSSTARKCDPSF